MHSLKHVYSLVPVLLFMQCIMNRILEIWADLRKKMPITYATFLIASLAISGIPLTSGFLSKDGILAGTFAFASLTGHWLFPVVGFFVAMLTAFYMFRLVILTFHGEPRNKEKYDHAHESPFVMAMPLVVLSALSIFILVYSKSSESGCRLVLYKMD